MQDLLAVALQRSGHNVRVVDSGETTLKLLQNDYFDLAIIDYSMPGMNALEILQVLSESEDEMPQIMILSAKSTPESIRECVEAGAQDYVVKPFNLPVLIERIEILLHKAGQAP